MKYLLLILLLPCSLVLGEIYKWTDESGRVHFGDSPPEHHKTETVYPEVNSYEHVSYEDIEFYQPSRSEPVVMYSTRWCGYCKKARAYFKEKQINYVEYDIEEDKRAKREYDALNGQGVPMILIGKKKMTGFNAPTFEKLFNNP